MEEAGKKQRKPPSTMGTSMVRKDAQQCLETSDELRRLPGLFLAERARKGQTLLLKEGPEHT